MLSLLFAVAIGAMLIRFWKDTSLQRDTFTDRQRWLIYGSIGAIALMIAGTDELLVERARRRSSGSRSWSAPAG